jgi:AcrR family transcriptional regulator
VSQRETDSVEREPSTSRGVATRRRILDAACDLVFERGAMAVTLDEILAATGTSKSQLYHYFADRSDLLRAVVTRQGERVLDLQRPVLGAVDGWEALARWRDFVVDVVEGLNCRGGCPIGSLADELAELDEPARIEAASAFKQWQALLADAFRAMVATGQLQPDADLDRLALATLASLEGGLLLAKTTRTTVPLEAALDAAIAHLRAFAVAPGRRPGRTGRR